MVDIVVSASLAILTISMAYLGVHVTLHPPNESPRARRWYKIGFCVCGLLAVSLVVTQGIRANRSQQRADSQISGLNGTVTNLRGDLNRVETATSLLRSEQTAEIARRQQAETDLALIVQTSGKAVREGVVSDIKKSPIRVQLSGQAITPPPLEVEDIKLLSEAEHSTHTDAPYAVKVTLQATTPIDPIRIAIRCSTEIKYVEFGYAIGLSPPGAIWTGDVGVYKNDPTIVIVNIKSNSGAAFLRPDLPLIVNIAASEPIVIKSFQRGPR